MVFPVWEATPKWDDGSCWMVKAEAAHDLFCDLCSSFREGVDAAERQIAPLRFHEGAAEWKEERATVKMHEGHGFSAW